MFSSSSLYKLIIFVNSTKEHLMNRMSFVTLENNVLWIQQIIVKFCLRNKTEVFTRTKGFSEKINQFSKIYFVYSTKYFLGAKSILAML